MSDRNVCIECGTDQVAVLEWQEPYDEDPKNYRRYYCAECGFNNHFKAEDDDD